MRSRRRDSGSESVWQFPVRLSCALVLVFVVLWCRGVLLRPLVVTSPPEPTTFPVETGAEGFSVYDEVVLLSPLSGEITPLVAEGEVVSRGTPVVRLEDPRREAYEERLQEVREAARTWKDKHESDLHALSRRVHKSAGDVTRAAVATRDGEDPAGVVQALQDLRLARDSLQDLRDEWLAWQDQVEELAELRDSAAEEIRAPRPGVIRTEFDGLETVLTPDVQLSEDLARALEAFEAAPGVGPGMLKREEVLAGSPLVRIQDHLRLEAVLLLSDEVPILPEQGARVTVHPEGSGRSVPARILDVLHRTEERDMLLVSVFYEMPYFYERRLWEANLEMTEIDAHRVPQDALVSRGAAAGAFVSDGNEITWHEVDVICRAQDSVIVTGLPDGVDVVQNPRLLQVARLE